MSFSRRAETVTIPPPYSFAPSGTFDGNDGSWSTFIINVGDAGDGNSGQNFKVLISTAGSVVTIPAQADWCTEPDKDSCAESRGIQTFNAKQSLGFAPASSASWQQIGIYDLPLPAALELYPDPKPNATYGHDTVGLGAVSASSPMLSDQLVAQIITQDFFMGVFGLSTTPLSIGGGPIDTFLTNFHASNQTSSLTYGYTAGAKYRNNNGGVLASLTLGGYDQSRFADKGISIPMPAGNTSLIVGVQSITVTPDPNIETNTYSMTAGTSGFLATIDSTLPYLWLPLAICDNIAKQFRLTYDNETNLYIVNDTSHAYNINQNATIAFTIGAGPNPSNSVASIVLPYSALDLTASFPIYTNATKYFPLKRSPTGIFVLGRALLQEAYLIVDYERRNFTVAPANFSHPMPSSHLVTIYPTSYVPPTPSKSSGLSTGAKAGIGAGCALLVLILLGLAISFFLLRRRRLNKTPTPQSPSEIDTLAAGTEVKKRRISELDSTPGSPPPRFSVSANDGYFGDQARDAKDREPFPPIAEIPILNELESPHEVSEMESVGATLGSNGGNEYFGLTWRSDRKEQPRVVHELPGDDGRFQVQGIHFEPVGSVAHSRDPSGSSASVSEATTPGLGSPVSPEGATLAEGYVTPFEDLGQLAAATSTVPTRASTVSGQPEGHHRDPSAVSSTLEPETPAGHRRDFSEVSSSPSSPTAEELESWALGHRGSGIDGRSLSRDRRGEGE